MRQLIRDFVQICSQTLPISGPIYEFGSYQVQGAFGDLRPFFPNKQYVGTDMREGPGVDLVVDIHDINLPSESAGTVIAVETLEHVEYPRKAMEGIYKVLKPQGLAIISSAMNLNIHDYPYDYWRFTPEAFKSLLQPFETSFVGFAGETQFPHTIIGVGFKGKLEDLSSFNSRFYPWKEYWSQPFKCNDLNNWKGLSRVIFPPFVYHMAKKLLNKPI